MGPSMADSCHSGLAHICRCVEIGFADLQVNHVAALRFKRPSTDQNFKCGFCAEALHAGRESHHTTFDVMRKCTVTTQAAGFGCKHNGAAVLNAPMRPEGCLPDPEP